MKVCVWNRTACIGALLLLALTSVLLRAEEAQWITAPGLDGRRAVVLHFRREIDLRRHPTSFPIMVSADNRFILYVNGQRVGAGPARGDLAHWREEPLDLGPFLHRDRNVVAALVGNAGTPKPGGISLTPSAAQISARTGFWISGAGKGNTDGIESGPTWRVSVQDGHSFSSPFLRLFKELEAYYSAGPQETIDGAKTDWNWNGIEESHLEWATAALAVEPGEQTPWTLVVDELPQMSYVTVPAGKVVRTNFADARFFPQQPAVIPPHSIVHVLLDRSTMVAAYPALTVSGGQGSKITMTYAEALYDAAKHKGDRNEVGDRDALGVADTFLPDGGERRIFSPLWWRVWRYIELTVQTADLPLTLNQLQVHGTGYPFEQRARFESDDEQLNAIWDIG